MSNTKTVFESGMSECEHDPEAFRPLDFAHQELERYIRSHAPHAALNMNNPIAPQVSASLKGNELTCTPTTLHSNNTKATPLTPECSALLDHYKLLEAGLNSACDALLMLDLQGHVRFSNDAFKHLFKIDLADAAVLSRAQFLAHVEEHLTDSGTLARAIQQTITNPAMSMECEFETSDRHYLEAQSRPHILEEKLVGQVWTFRDVTQLRLKEEESKHRAYHDSLTGLPNRRLLAIRLNQTLMTQESSLPCQTKRENYTAAVLFVDLDGFKDVNDSLGHNVGDALLKEVAFRLESILPSHSFLSRHGGDEFVVVLEQVHSEKQVISFCEQVIQCFDHSFRINREEIYMSVSIGVAMAPEHGNDADKLLSNADMAMYQAKQQGKHTYEFFTTAKDTHAYQRLKIRNQLNVALEQNEFELFFQPKICLEDGSIKGAEALIRWRPNGEGFRSPMEFIPIAEESGQIIPISQWVINRCCQHMMEWNEFLDDDFVLALNISAKHFQRGLLQQDISEALQEFKIDPFKLEIEVTETAIMDNIDLAVETLDELKKIGIRTAIDDFGTGHSSLSYLRQLPIEVLKIDKSFIDEIVISSEDRTLVRGIIEMVHALGIQVVAEGVENHEIAETLQEMNCDLVQGYHYCKPISEEEFVELIKSRQCYL